MSANFIAQTLTGYLARAAERESEKFAGSRTIVYSTAARWLFVVGTLVGALVFSMAVSSMPEERRAELACFLGVILLLPISLGGAEFFFTRITYDETFLWVSRPWTRSCRIPWTAVTECRMAEGEYYVTLYTQGHGVVKMNTFMRGVGELIDLTLHHIIAQAQAMEREVALHEHAGRAPPVLSVTVIGKEENFLRLIGGILIVSGVVAMLWSAFMPGTKPSAYTTISGELREYSQTRYDGSQHLNLSVRDSAAGPLLPGTVRYNLNFIFKSIPPAFPSGEFLQSARKGLRITLTLLAEDAVRARTTTAPVVEVEGIQMDGRDYYTLAQYLAALEQQRFMLMLFGVLAAIAGAAAFLLRRRKSIY